MTTSKWVTQSECEELIYTDTDADFSILKVILKL